MRSPFAPADPVLPRGTLEAATPRSQRQQLPRQPPPVSGIAPPSSDAVGVQQRPLRRPARLSGQLDSPHLPGAQRKQIQRFDSAGVRKAGRAGAALLGKQRAGGLFLPFFSLSESAGLRRKRAGGTGCDRFFERFFCFSRQW